MTPVPRPDVRVRTYRGQFLLARGEHVLELSEVAVFIWRQLDGARTLDDITRAVAEHYDIDVDTAGQDCAELVDSLTQVGMVELREQ